MWNTQELFSLLILFRDERSLNVLTTLAKAISRYVIDQIKRAARMILIR